MTQLCPKTNSKKEWLLKEDSIRKAGKSGVQTPNKGFKSLDQVITDSFEPVDKSQEGRDKMVKFFQYFAKYMSWYYTRDGL